jgi:MFS superfamily sulfate permease-like transporter
LRRLERTEMLLVLACAGAAGMLAASQFMSIFELTPPGGEALSEVDAADQHGPATLVLAAFALVLIAVSIATRGLPISEMAAVAVAVCGVVALLIFLIVDLPDAGNVGTLDDARESFIDAKAEPQPGFWFELAGSLVLAVCGAVLATTRRPDQAIGERPREPGDALGDAGSEEAGEPSLARTQEERRYQR